MKKLVLLGLTFISCAHGQTNKVEQLQNEQKIKKQALEQELALFPETQELQKLYKEKQNIIDTIKNQSDLLAINAKIAQVTESIRPLLTPLLQTMRELLKNPQQNQQKIQELQKKVGLIKQQAKSPDGISLSDLEKQLREIQKGVRLEVKKQTESLNVRIADLEKVVKEKETKSLTIPKLRKEISKNTNRLSNIAKKY